MLELYVRRADGSSYWAADAPDTPDGRRTLDRLAWIALSRPNVVGVSVQETADRRGGYRR